MAYTTHKGDWLHRTFDDNVVVVWNAMTYGYGVDETALGTYGLWRKVGPNQGRVAVGTFESPQEVVAILKLLLATHEHEQRRV